MGPDGLARFERRERLHALIWARLRVSPCTLAELRAVITAVGPRELQRAVRQLRAWNWITHTDGRWRIH